MWADVPQFAAILPYLVSRHALAHSLGVAPRPDSSLWKEGGGGKGGRGLSEHGPPKLVCASLQARLFTIAFYGNNTAWE